MSVNSHVNQPRYSKEREDKTVDQQNVTANDPAEKQCPEHNGAKDHSQTSRQKQSHKNQDTRGQPERKEQEPGDF